LVGGPSFEVESRTFWVDGPRSEVERPRFEVEGGALEADSPTLEVPRWASEVGLLHARSGFPSQKEPLPGL